MTRKTPANYDRSVFINCPFDTAYESMLEAIVFATMFCRCVARCALEIDDGSEVRIEKIVRIVEQCRLGIHDLSRTELDPEHALPRFNMPFELGLFMGAKRFGTRSQKQKSILILDTERFRYQKFLSDIAGQDIKAHDGTIKKAVGHVRNWLASNLEINDLPGQDAVMSAHARFRSELPAMCQKKRMNPAQLTFNDMTNFMHEWQKADARSFE